MNARVADPGEWTRARWLSAFGLVMVLQAALILLLSRRPSISRPQPDAPLTVSLVAAAPAGTVMDEWLALDDPTLFALPDARAFSGPAWLRVPRLKHRSQDWTEPVPWRTQSVHELGATFSAFMRTNLPGPRLLADKPPPPVSEVNVPPVPLRSQSAVRIEGDLASRGLLNAIKVPSIEHTNILRSTVVRVRVDMRGRIFSHPIVMESSGSEAIDRQALEQVRTLRFKPAMAGDANRPPKDSTLTSGSVVFEWHWVERRATNINGAVIAPM